MVSVGGVTAYIDYCGKAQLLHAASGCVTSPKRPVFSSPTLSCFEEQQISHYHKIIALQVQLFAFQKIITISGERFYNQSIFYDMHIKKEL